MLKEIAKRNVKRFVAGDFRKQQIKKTIKHCYIKIVDSFIQEKKPD